MMIDETNEVTSGSKAAQHDAKNTPMNRPQVGIAIGQEILSLGEAYLGELVKRQVYGNKLVIWRRY